MSYYLFHVVRDGKAYEVEVTAESLADAEALLAPLHNVMYVAEGELHPSGQSFGYTAQLPRYLQ